MAIVSFFRNGWKLMRGTISFQRVAVCCAMVGLCLPQMALAAGLPGQKPVVTDVQLHDGGTLYGRVVNADYRPVVREAVALSSGGRRIDSGQTNHDGYFAFEGLQSGVYQVTLAHGQGAYRVWARGTAPPSAPPQVLIVNGADTVRGQQGMRTVRNFLSNPIVIAGIVATAVAVPVAIHNANKYSGSP